MLARGLFESYDDLEERCINLKKDVQQLIESEKSYADKFSSLEKKFLEDSSKTSF